MSSKFQISSDEGANETLMKWIETLMRFMYLWWNKNKNKILWCNSCNFNDIHRNVMKSKTICWNIWNFDETHKTSMKLRILMKLLIVQQFWAFTNLLIKLLSVECFRIPSNVYQSCELFFLRILKCEKKREWTLKFRILKGVLLVSVIEA